MAKKEKQPERIIKPELENIVISLPNGKGGFTEYTFEGTLCYKDGKPYGRIVEENESHIIVELRNENPNEYPQRHEFRKEQITKEA